MKYFLVIGEFSEDAKQDDKFKALLNEHHMFTSKGIEEGWILFAGPRPTGGGVFVIKADSIEEATSRFNNDPFKINGINVYDFVEFRYFTGQKDIKSWFE